MDAVGRRSSYFAFRPVVNNWCSKSHGVHCPVAGMKHEKVPCC